MFEIKDGWLMGVEHCPSPHFNQRPSADDISLLVIHNISLPPGKFGSNHISQLFLGQLDPTDDPYFVDIYQLQVSAHCLVRRDGSIIQYVSFYDRAWHAGVSEFCGRTQCNDFSIGIELEGTDDTPYTDSQYQSLVSVVEQLLTAYPKLDLQSIVGHCDIAPGRKTDPGAAFDWQYFKKKVESVAS